MATQNECPLHIHQLKCARTTAIKNFPAKGLFGIAVIVVIKIKKKQFHEKQF